MGYLTLEDVGDSLENKLVFFRPDTNTTLDKGKWKRTERIEVANRFLHTLLSEYGAKVIIGVHNARKGSASYVSVEPLSEHLGAHWMGNTYGKDDNLNSTAIRRIKELAPRESLLLENLRFMPGEQAPKGHIITPEEFAQQQFIRQLIDECGVEYAVLDAFSVAHRNCRSMEGFYDIPNIAGDNMMKELRVVRDVQDHLDMTNKSNVLVLGGMKIEDYIDLIRNTIDEGKVAKIITGGLLANLMLKIQGYDIGKASSALLEEKGLMGDDTYGVLKSLYDAHPTIFAVPIDLGYMIDGAREDWGVENVPKKAKDEGIVWGLGPKTVKKYVSIIEGADMVFCKGPMTKIEEENFREASRDLLSAIYRRTRQGKLFSVLGGGDTAEMVANLGFGYRGFTYVSLSGGALLKALAGVDLPGVVRLEESYEQHRPVA